LHQLSLKRFIGRYLNNAQDIEDVTQEAFLRAYKAEQTTCVQQPKSFLFRIAKNVAISQLRTAAAQQAGAFDDEIVPVTASKMVVDKETSAVSYEEVTLTQDEGNRTQTQLDNLAALKPVIDGGSITAGNASQLSDGASASVLMERKLAEPDPSGYLPRYGGGWL
jgi:DNA-directed RNA polymerase specialized sigma24 family protein